jgi:cytochrome c-type biogenesis protein CcmF
MIFSGAELGHAALWLALGVALVQALLPLPALARGDGRAALVADRAAVIQMLLIGLAFAMLMRAFLISDFSVLLVAQHSHTLKPLLYKITGLWANHEGSLLLWSLILALCGALVALLGQHLPPDFRARVLAVIAMIACGFLLFMLLTSNPFARLSPVPAHGNGLNPILQDPGLAFHPPLLYVGYVGLSISFAFAIAALIEGRIGPLWARWVRPWTLFAWIFLTLGIALGSWWAYYELGWGGYWFWDPVENAALMPWLAATALLHSVIVLEKRDTLKAWTILLAIIAFSLSLMGTFIVRSGILTSVHSFATDPSRGLFILLFLALVVGGALTLFALRASSLEGGAAFATLSRESMLVGNNLLLGFALTIVFFGTLYPLALDAFAGEQISVGPPFYEATFVPVFSLLILLMATGPMASWRQDRLARMRPSLIVASVVMICGVAVTSVVRSMPSPIALAGFVVSFWLVGGVIADLAQRCRFGDGGTLAALRRLRRLPISAWSLALGHLGIAIVAFAVTATGAWQKEALLSLQPGTSVAVGEFQFRLERVLPMARDNYTGFVAQVSVSRGDRLVATLTPESRSYASPPMETTEASIHPLLTGDLYAVLGKPDEDGNWQARFHWKPFVSWIWLGCLVMAMGGLLAMCDRKLRLAAGTRA